MAVSVTSVLAKVPFFAGVAEAELETLARSLQRRSVRGGKAVFRQDDPGSSLYVIESGVVKVQRTSPEGKEVILAILGAGDFFGELALLDGEPRSADAIAKEDTALLVLERDDFLAFLDKGRASPRSSWRRSHAACGARTSWCRTRPSSMCPRGWHGRSCSSPSPPRPRPGSPSPSSPRWWVPRVRA